MATQHMHGWHPQARHMLSPNQDYWVCLHPCARDCPAQCPTTWLLERSQPLISPSMLHPHAALQPSPTHLLAGSPEDKRDAKRQRSPEIQPLSPEPPAQNRKPASSSLQPARSHRSLPSVLEHSPLRQLARPERSAASLHPLLLQGTPDDEELAVEPSQAGQADAGGCSGRGLQRGGLPGQV